MIVDTVTNGSSLKQDYLNKEILSTSSKVRRDAEPRRAGGKFKRPFGGLTRKPSGNKQLFDRLRRVNKLGSRGLKRWSDMSGN